MENDLHNHTYVVTGATSGIGLAAAEILVRRGAGVIGVGRSAERCKAVEAHLRHIHPDAPVHYVVADLSLQKNIHQVADEILNQLAGTGKPVLDGLLNNAGTFTYWMTLTAEGIEMQWAVNHLASFLLTHRLIPALQAAPLARVVTVSSGSHRHGWINWNDPQLRRCYNGLRAYGNTKLANILFTLEFNRRLGTGSTIRAFAANPGLVKTDIGMKGNPAIAGLVWKLRRSGGIPAEESARGIVYLLTEPSIQESTEVYWKHGLPQHASRRALDPADATRLWMLSEKMCGLDGGNRHDAA